LRRRSDLFHEQHQILSALKKNPQQAIFLKPGGGKTAATLTHLVDVNAFPALVVAPIKVVEEVWEQEAREWAYLNHLQFVRLRGSVRAREERLATEGGHIYLINYELLPWLVEALGGTLADRFQAVVFDELSMMKNPGSKRFRAVRNRLDGIPTRIGLTGTPTGNSLLNLWSEMWCVADDKPLGKSFTAFKVRYFMPVDRDQFVWRPRFEAQQQIMRCIKPWATSVKVKRKPEEVRYVTRTVTLPPRALTVYRSLEERLMAEVEGNMVLVRSEMALAGKIRQVCSGALYTDLLGDWEALHTAKLDAIGDLIEELEGSPLLVFYEFQHELTRLQERFNAQPIDVENWNRGRIQVMAVHPQQCGHGINLQHGGSDIAWMTLPWSWELWTQANARLARPGQRNPVTVHSIACADTIDGRVARSLQGHGQTETEVMRALA
jgi:SNF2 family DNA or RNA helicase